MMGTLSSSPAKDFEGNELKDVPPETIEELKKLETIFTVDKEKLKRITDHFVKELEKGLRDEGGNNIPMNVTWVMGYPTGHEKGKFLTIDMGGTNLRICQVTLTEGKGKYDIIQSKYEMAHHLKTSTADELWSFIADCTGKFIEEHQLVDEHTEEKLPLAFTFSYPVTQPTIRNGILQRWTKDFDVKGVEGHDVVPQFEAALDKRKIPVRIVALVNDTTGTLIASAYDDPEIKIGSIFSTGVNSAYMENVGSIPKIKEHGLPDDMQIAINTEYGAFDNERKVLPTTKYDRLIDETSPRPGQQMFEKMVSGLYIGEAFRLVLLDLHERNLVFKGQDVSTLRQSRGIDTAFLSTVEGDVSESLTDIAGIFNDVLKLKPEVQELRVCRYLVQLIGTRAARLYACGISAICKKKGLTSCHVGVDGSVFNKYHHFRVRAAQGLREILDWAPGIEDPVKLCSAEDGSGVGAALIAAIALERPFTGNAKNT